MILNPPPPPPDRPAGGTLPYFDACDFPASANAAAVAMVLNEFLRSLPLLSSDPASGTVHVRHVMRDAGLSWPAVLIARTGAYDRQLRLYGHASSPSPTALDRCGPTPPDGRGPDRAWLPGWVGVCAQAVAERTAWVPVPVLVEMALLAGMRRPMPHEVERADALTRSVWLEPAVLDALED